MLLRPRQEEFVARCVAALGERRNTLGVAPTGAGKTVMLSAVVKRSGAGRALILQHRDELVEQNRRTFHLLNGLDVRSGVVDGRGKDFTRPVTFGMVQTLARDANLAMLPPVDLVVVDEAHHIAAGSYKRIVDRAREMNGAVALMGVTATPNRGDKKALAAAFDNVADQITLGELIQSGALVRPRTFVVDIGVRGDLQRVKRSVSDFDMSEVAKIMDRQILNDQVVAKWKEIAGDRQTVVFCSTVEHAGHVRDAFSAGGVSAGLVSGEMPEGERRSTLAAFDRSEFQVLVNVAVLTEGWDCQPVSCVVLLRPASFASTMIQMIGRGLRRLDPERYPGRRKSDCIVIDFGTSILTHGSLEQHVDLDPQKGEARKKLCPDCGAEIPMFCRECAICGHVFEVVEEAGGGGAGEPEALENFVLTEIDLFKQSPFRWEPLWDGVVLVATGFDAWAVVVNFAGQWNAVGGARSVGMRLLSVGDKLLCLSTADDWMREHEDATASGKAKKWLHLPASDKQANLIGLPAHAMTRYEAACRITWKFQERGIRSKIEGANMQRAA